MKYRISALRKFDVYAQFEISVTFPTRGNLVSQNCWHDCVSVAFPHAYTRVYISVAFPHYHCQIIGCVYPYFVFRPCEYLCQTDLKIPKGGFLRQLCFLFMMVAAILSRLNVEFPEFADGVSYTRNRLSLLNMHYRSCRF